MCYWMSSVTVMCVLLDVQSSVKVMYVLLDVQSCIKVMYVLLDVQSSGIVSVTGCPVQC